MAETFYSVLGVESDADTETIRDAYRAQVKETHPDVSDDDDAADTFKRLTAARDVLVDDSSRNRYDRVGHTVYVRDHLDSAAWSVEPEAADRSPGSDATGAAGDAESGTGGRSTGRTNSSDRNGPSDDSNAENYQRYRSSRARTGASERDDTGRTGRRERTGRRGRSGRTGRTAGADARDSGTDEADSGGPDAGGTETDEYGTWSTDAGQDWAFSGSSSASTATGGRSVDPRDRTRSDGWQAAHAATSAYTPSGYEPTAPTADDVGTGSLRSALRQVGPWLAFHFVFLISAFVTVWLIMTWIPSVPMLFVSLLLLGATVFFSILHMVSQVYS